MTMRFCVRISALVVIGCVQGAVNPSVDVVIAPKGHAPVKLLCVTTTPTQPFVSRFVGYVQQILGASDQFKVVCEQAPTPRAAADFKGYADRGYSLGIFFATPDAHTIEWRLYDTFDQRLVKGATSKQGILSEAEWALSICQQLWPELTSVSGSFASLIVACKRVGSARRMTRQDLYVIHPFLTFDQFDPRMLVADGADNVCPRWHVHKNVIFYSQHTPINVRLMSVDEHKKRHVVLSLDGQSLSPAVSRDKKVVVALSFQGGTRLYQYTFDRAMHASAFTCLTPGKGDWVAPSFLNNERIVFSHIDKATRARVGILNLMTREITWLNVPGAFDPVASPDGTRIAYSKLVGGAYQIFVYTVVSGVHVQITHDGRHKTECSWSPCGNYMVCSVEDGRWGRLGVVDVRTHVLRLITPKGQNWSHPCWSGSLALPFAFGRDTVGV